MNASDPRIDRRPDETEQQYYDRKRIEQLHKLAKQNGCVYDEATGTLLPVMPPIEDDTRSRRTRV